MTFQGFTSTIVALLLSTCHCLGATGHSRSGAPLPTTTTSLATDGSSFESKIVESIPHYHPEQSVSGVIRLWGHGNVKLPWMKQLVGFWEDGFRRSQPGVRKDRFGLAVSSTRYETPEVKTIALA